MPCPIKFKPFSHVLNMDGPHVYVSYDWAPAALASILDGLQDMRDDSALCQAIANHMDFADLVARVAAVKHLRDKIERSEIDLTATERDTLDRLAADPCGWISSEARGALDDLAKPLPDQVAEHDGADAESAIYPEMRRQLDLIEQFGVDADDHATLNYIRANSTGAIRDRAGALLVKLANLPGVAK